MASLPPDTIQVKRKRGTDDSPVDFLRVEGHKRHRSVSGEAVWVYQRKQAPTERKNGTGASLPIIQATREGDENRPVKALRQKILPASKTETGLDVSKSSAVKDEPTNEQMRRFHLSIADSSRLAAGTSRKRSAPAVFVERSPKRNKETTESIHGPIDAPKDQGQTAQPPVHSAPSAQGSSSIKYKRPGVRARITPKPELPPSLVNRDKGVDMDQLARDMDAYTLSQITQNIAKMDEDSAKIAARQSQANKSKYKPKPAPRYAERHPEYAAAQAKAAEAQKADAMVTDNTGGDASDDDYVTETYERVPASRLRDQAVPVTRVGLLVFDTEPDMVEFFYGDEGDSDDELLEDDENENAENYYTADYPDEDMDWDDTFNRNPYRYLNNNASDQEEFDTNEDGFLDVVWESSRAAEDDKNMS